MKPWQKRHPKASHKTPNILVLQEDIEKARELNPKASPPELTKKAGEIARIRHYGGGDDSEE